MANDSQIPELLNGLLDAFNAHDIDRVMSFFAEGHRGYSSLRTRLRPLFSTTKTTSVCGYLRNR